METGLTKNRIISELTRSTHGELKEYVPLGREAAKKEPEFLAHLIAWDRSKGQIRDAKVALPIVSLSANDFPVELAENSWAHLTILNPRELLKALHFAMDVKLPGRMSTMSRLVAAYLKKAEANAPRFERMALQHRETMRSLYSLVHVKPAEFANIFLHGRTLDKKKAPYPSGSLFEAVANLKNMTPLEAAGTIMTRKIPFLIAIGALGEKAKEPDLVLALMKQMTANEVINNTKMLERLGVKANSALRGAFEEALTRAAKSSDNLLKATTAAEAIEDEELKEKLRGVQERKLQNAGVDGNWVVLGDKSGSMSQAINVAVEVSATLAKMVKGKVYLVFFDTAPHAIDVTGMSLDAIKAKTRYIKADGGTSVGCGLKWILENGHDIDGVAIVSDAQENTPPFFPDVHKAYADKFSKDLPVYLYHCDGGYETLISSMRHAGIDMQVFDLRGTRIDYYALPNLVQTMRTNRYSLVDEIMDAPLLKLSGAYDGVLSKVTI